MTACRGTAKVGTSWPDLAPRSSGRVIAQTTLCCANALTRVSVLSSDVSTLAQPVLVSSGGWFAVSTASRSTTSAAKLSRVRSTRTSAKRCLCLASGLIFRRDCGSCMTSLRHGVRTNRPSCSGATRTTAGHSSADGIRPISRRRSGVIPEHWPSRAPCGLGRLVSNREFAPGTRSRCEWCDLSGEGTLVVVVVAG
jgi:hypothetical protein